MAHSFVFKLSSFRPTTTNEQKGAHDQKHNDSPADSSVKYIDSGQTSYDPTHARSQKKSKHLASTDERSSLYTLTDHEQSESTLVEEDTLSDSQSRHLTILRPGRPSAGSDRKRSIKSRSAGSTTEDEQTESHVIDSRSCSDQERPEVRKSVANVSSKKSKTDSKRSGIDSLKKKKSSKSKSVIPESATDDEFSQPALKEAGKCRKSKSKVGSEGSSDEKPSRKSRKTLSLESTTEDEILDPVLKETGKCRKSKSKVGSEGSSDEKPSRKSRKTLSLESTTEDEILDHVLKETGKCRKSKSKVGSEGSSDEKPSRKSRKTLSLESTTEDEILDPVLKETGKSGKSKNKVNNDIPSDEKPSKKSRKSKSVVMEPTSDDEFNESIVKESRKSKKSKSKVNSDVSVYEKPNQKSSRSKPFNIESTTDDDILEPVVKETNKSDKKSKNKVISDTSSDEKPKRKSSKTKYLESTTNDETSEPVVKESSNTKKSESKVNSDVSVYEKPHKKSSKSKPFNIESTTDDDILEPVVKETNKSDKKSKNKVISDTSSDEKPKRKSSKTKYLESTTDDETSEPVVKESSKTKKPKYLESTTEDETSEPIVKESRKKSKSKVILYEKPNQKSSKPLDIESNDEISEPSLKETSKKTKSKDEKATQRKDEKATKSKRSKTSLEPKTSKKSNPDNQKPNTQSATDSSDDQSEATLVDEPLQQAKTLVNYDDFQNFQTQVIEPKPRKKKTIYSREVVLELLRLVNERGLSLSSACRSLNIASSTAQHWVLSDRRWRQSGGNPDETPAAKRKSGKVFTEKHQEFVADSLKRDPHQTLPAVYGELMRRFPDVRLSIWSFYYAVTRDMGLVTAHTRPYAREKNSPKTLEERQAWAKAHPNLDFSANCLFLGGIQLNRRKSYRYQKDLDEEIVLPKQSYLVALSSNAVVNLEKVSKIEMDKDEECTDDVVGFLDRTLKGLDRVNGFAPTYVVLPHELSSYVAVKYVVIRHQLVPVFLPNCSRELNPVEEFWRCVRHLYYSMVTRTNTDSDLVETVKKVSAASLVKFCNKSMANIDKCLSKTPF